MYLFFLGQNLENKLIFLSAHLSDFFYFLGNIILTDHEHVILAVLRPRLNDENNKVIVRETYPVSNEKQDTQEESITIEKLNEIVEKANPTDNMKKMFVPHCSAGPALLGKTPNFKNRMH